MTINVALDKIFTCGTPTFELQVLKQKLLTLKFQHGGNTKIENQNVILDTIEKAFPKK